MSTTTIEAPLSVLSNLPGSIIGASHGSINSDIIDNSNNTSTTSSSAFIITVQGHGVFVYIIDSGACPLSWSVSSSVRLLTSSIQNRKSKNLFAAIRRKRNSPTIEFLRWECKADAKMDVNAVISTVQMKGDVFCLIPCGRDDAVAVLGDGTVILVSTGDIVKADLDKKNRGSKNSKVVWSDIVESHLAILVSDEVTTSLYSFEFSFGEDEEVKCLKYSGALLVNIPNEGSLVTAAAYHEGKLLILDDTGALCEFRMSGDGDSIKHVRPTIYVGTEFTSAITVLGATHALIASSTELRVIDLIYGTVQATSDLQGCPLSMQRILVNEEEGCFVSACLENAVMVVPVHCAPISLANVLGRCSSGNVTKQPPMVAVGSLLLTSSSTSLSVENWEDIVESTESSEVAVIKDLCEDVCNVTDFNKTFDEYMSHAVTRRAACIRTESKKKNKHPGAWISPVLVASLMKRFLADDAPFFPEEKLKLLIEEGVVSHTTAPMLIPVCVAGGYRDLLVAALQFVHGIPEAELVNVIRLGIRDNDKALLDAVIRAPRCDAFLPVQLAMLSTEEALALARHLLSTLQQRGDSKKRSTTPPLSAALDWVAVLLDARFTEMVLVQECHHIVAQLGESVDEHLNFCRRVADLSGALKDVMERTGKNQQRIQPVGSYAIEYVNV